MLAGEGCPFAGSEIGIVIKAAGDGEVIFDGDGNSALFNVMAADYTYFEGITFHNTEFAIWAGQQSIAGRTRPCHGGPLGRSGYGAGANPERSTHSPSRMTRSMSRVFRMSASGSAFSTTRSATLPASRVP